MRNTYEGYCQGHIKCSNYGILLDAINNGDWFRTKSMSWYYVSVPFRERDGRMKPNDVMCFHVHGVTSITTHYTRFVKLEEDTNGCTVYTKEDLESLICKDLNKFARNMSPKTLRIGTTSFESYLNAIPKDIFLKAGFDKQMLKSLRSGFVQRLKKSAIDDEQQMQNFNDMTKRTLNLFNKSFKSKSLEQDLLESSSEETYAKILMRRESEINSLFDKNDREKN